MRKKKLTTILFAVLLFSFSIGADASSRRRAASAGHLSSVPWTDLEISTSGGFIGVGAGSVLISAGGTITATDPVGSKTCSTQLSAADRATLDEVIDRANPTAWHSCYSRAENPGGCCDQIQYRLRLKIRDVAIREKSFTTFWFTENSSTLPADLARLFETAWNLGRRTTANCN